MKATTGEDRDFIESEADHLDTLRISAFFDDLEPGKGGQVSVPQRADGVVITWQDISEHGRTYSKTFQVEMYFDGRIRMS